MLEALHASPSEQTACLRLLDVPRALHAERGALHADPRLSLGDMLFGLRQRSGKTQEEAARSGDISRALYAQWENDVSRPTTAQLHAMGYALGAEAEEIVTLSLDASADTPLPKSRDELIQCYMETLPWYEGITKASYRLFLLTLLAHLRRLFRVGKADIGDLALIVSNFGDCAEMWDHDLDLRDRYYRRARLLANKSEEPLHFHLVRAFTSLLPSPSNLTAPKSGVSEALGMQFRFRHKAGQAYLLSYVADAIALEAPDEALRLAEKYCLLVADNGDEHPCRLRDRGNLLLRCGQPAESVAYIATLTPPDLYREGLKELDMAAG